ncbi:MAG: BppU family phage baseplate upper protein [Gordonibacter sp.]
MALNEEWYLDEIELDDTNSFIADLHANAGDLNGRGISLTVAHNSQPVDMTGMSVYLAWGHEFSGEGLEKFTAINATTGRWKVLYPNAMQRRGKVLARVMIYLTGKDTPITSSNNFRIHVAANPVNDKTLVADNDFSVFQRAVVDLHEAEGCATAATTAANTAASASATQTAACAAATNAALDVATTALSKRRADSTYANALIGSVQGAMAHVEDAWEADAVECRVEGKSAQAATVGKNLLRCIKTAPETRGGVSFTPLSDGGIKIVGTAADASAYINLDFDSSLASAVSAVPVGSVTASGTVAGVTFGQGSFSADGSFANVHAGNGTFAYQSSGAKMRTYLAVPAGGTVNVVVYPQIELGTVATPFEPYSGGKPSPSPDYPQEIDVVDGPVVVEACGKNLLSAPEFACRQTGATIKYQNILYLPIGAEFVVDGAAADGLQCSNANASIVWEDEANRQILNLSIGKKYGAHTVNVDLSQATKMHVYLSDAFAGKMAAIQLELGSAATPFEPYAVTKQTITLPADHNYLASLPDGTRDTLALRADGVAVLVERTNKQYLFGSDVTIIPWETNNAAKKRHILKSARFNNKIGDNATTKLNACCNKLICCSAHATYSCKDGTLSSYQTTLQGFVLFVAALATKTEAEVAQWLADNKCTVTFEKATPITRYSADNGATWSTADPAAGMSAVQLHKGTNNVWCTDPLSPDVSLAYVQDTNQVIAELRAAVVASGATR